MPNKTSENGMWGISWKGARRVLVYVTIVSAIVAFTTKYFYQPTKIEGMSMVPTLHDGDRCVVGIHPRMMRILQREDMIVLALPNNSEEFLIKRIIGLPGERIEVYVDGSVAINGNPLAEPYLPASPRQGKRYLEYVATVPESAYFVLGDNRGASRDSRTFGPVPHDRVIGKITFVFWCPTKIVGFFRDFGQFFFPSTHATAQP